MGADRMGHLESVGQILRLPSSRRHVQKIKIKIIISAMVSIYSGLARVQNVICATVGKWVGCVLSMVGMGGCKFAK